MAGKKKKKPASNPARGFATTSLPSKSKDILASHDEEPTTPLNEPQCVAESVETHDTSRHGKSLTGDVAAMSPEEFERHLEQAELERLVEANALRVKNDATRQVARLQNERRQMRQHADRVTIGGLTDQFVEDILMRDSSSLPIYLPSNRGKTRSGADEHELLLGLWTLHEVLIQLNMPVVDNALAYILSAWRRNEISTSSGQVTGLEEVLVWYARQMNSTELPDYETGKVSNEEDAADAMVLEIANSAHQEPLTEQEANVVQGVQRSKEDIEASLEDSTSDDEQDGEEDDNPDNLVDHWIRLQTAKFELEQDVDMPVNKLTSKKKKTINHLQTIERDILFDADVAQQRWLPLLRDLQIDVGQANKKKKKKTLCSIAEKRIATSDTDSEACDADQMLRGMFGDEDGNIQTSLVLDSNSTVDIHDFGTWSGVHPRRLLEEACADRLARNGIKFRPLLTTSHSVRLQFDIFWKVKTVGEELSRTCVPQGIVFETKPLSWTLRMETYATKTLSQGEACLGAISLFLLVSSEHVNSKLLSRLPKTWKDFVSELQKQRDEAVLLEDMAKVRHLRAIIGAARADAVAGLDAEGRGKISPAHVNGITRTHLTKLSSDAAKALWLRRANTAAFDRMQTCREDLPIFHHKQEVLQAFESNQVLIICAETGAGKSTQVPSYILENELSNGRDYNIIVTQPRRISAISIARRVSSELGESNDALGTARSLIGYAIRLESKTSSTTRVTFATTGVLLRMLQDSPNLDHLDCLILDEVHERTMDLDLLFIALKRLRRRRSSLKIVLMSATVSSDKFSSYFDGAPVLEILGRTFPVDVRYLEDAIEETCDVHTVGEATLGDNEGTDDTEDGDELADDSTVGLEKYSAATRRSLAQYDHNRIDYDLITKLAIAIATKPKFTTYSSAMLIFMPGIGEIRRLYNILVTSKVFSSRWTIYMLHSSFSTQELEQAFLVPPSGVRKIVIATNIAETGITIPDVTAVIDTCKEKVMRFDERRQLSRLTEGPIARASAKQRRGRAARVQEGLCFHLVTRYRFETKMPEQATPEILRLSLQDPILRVKIWDLGPIEEVLAAAIDPPSAKNVRRAALKLQDVGAIDATERLTPLGHIIAKLPLDVALAKMAVYGVLFQCLDTVITIIASFSVKSIFSDKGQANLVSQDTFAHGESDFLTTYNAYLGWKKATRIGTEHQFCRKYALNHFQLKQLEEQKIQLIVYLLDAGLIVLDAQETASLHGARNSKSPASNFEVPTRYGKFSSDSVVAATIAVALYPKLLRREGKGYRNVYTNQHLQLAPTSINRMTSKPPTWLVYLEASQSKNGKLNAFHSSRVTQATLILLFGEAEFKFFAGVADIDNGRVRLSFRSWKEMLALQQLRFQINRIVDKFLAKPGLPFLASDQQWLDLTALTLDGPLQSRTQE